MSTKIKLPKWFDGHVGTKSENITNLFTGESYMLKPEEVAMYDFVMGLQFVIDKRGGLLDPRTFPLQKELRKGLDWFRENNAKAYMVLLD